MTAALWTAASGADITACVIAAVLVLAAVIAILDNRIGRKP